MATAEIPGASRSRLFICNIACTTVKYRHAAYYIDTLTRVSVPTNRRSVSHIKVLLRLRWTLCFLFSLVRLFMTCGNGRPWHPNSAGEGCVDWVVARILVYFFFLTRLTK
jgi:hypothetical protein